MNNITEKDIGKHVIAKSHPEWGVGTIDSIFQTEHKRPCAVVKFKKHVGDLHEKCKGKGGKRVYWFYFEDDGICREDYQFSDLELVNSEEEKEMELKDYVGKRVHHGKFGDGTVIGVGGYGPELLIEFDNENMDWLHDGNGFKPVYGATQGKPDHCYYLFPYQITLIGNQMTNDEVISILRKETKTTQNEELKKAIETVMKAYKKEEAPLKLRESVQLFQEENGATRVYIPVPQFKKFVAEILNCDPEKVEIPMGNCFGGTHFKETVRLYYKDTWDSLTGKKEAVKKMENHIRKYAEEQFLKKYEGMKQRADKFTLYANDTDVVSHK